MSCDVDLDYSENSENTGSVGIWRRGPLKCVNNLIGEREGERQRERERESACRQGDKRAIRGHRDERQAGENL